LYNEAPPWLLLSKIPETHLISHNRRIRAILNRIHAGFDAIIAEARQISSVDDDLNTSILTQLLFKHDQSKDNDEQPLKVSYSMKDLKDDMLSLFFAGHETACSTISSSSIFHANIKYGRIVLEKN
jgi:cytochrome P450